MPKAKESGAALIVNASARTGDSALEGARDCLAAQGTAIRGATAVADAKGLTEAVRSTLADGCNPIIVGGGDGTISAAAGILAGTGRTLGVLPLGTANDFARTLGIPDDLEGACAVIAAGHERQVDLGKAGDCYFLNLASLGLAGDVAAALPTWLKRVLGKLAYPVATLHAIRRFQPFDVTLACAGEIVVLRGVLQLGIGNGRFYGGGMSVAPDAAPDDGWLDVYAIRHQGLPRLLAIARQLKAGTHVRERGVYYIRTSGIDIAASRPLAIDVDGELIGDGQLIGETPCRFAVARAALRVLAPLDHDVRAGATNGGEQ